MTAAAVTAEGPEFRRLGTTLFIVALIFALLAIDSTWVAARVPYNQWIANVLMIVAFVGIYKQAPVRLQRIMKYGVVVATVGEVFFSLVVGMYEYRLENVPLYVPPGHSIVYAGVYYFVHEPFVLKRKRAVIGAMLALSVGYALYWYAVDNDTYGLLCSALFLALIVVNKDSRLFFLAMFLFVAYLEQIGTRFDCWYWHRAVLDRFEWFPSGNPPSGISVFYFGFDVTCLWAYMTRNPEIRDRWRRLRDHKRSRDLAASTQGAGIAVSGS